MPHPPLEFWEALVGEIQTCGSREAYTIDDECNLVPLQSERRLLDTC